jgi:DNA primase
LWSRRDVIRLVELLDQVSFTQAVARLRALEGGANVVADAAAFYRQQLRHHGVAIDYLHQRGISDPDVMSALGIGYAAGACLRAHLSQLGYGASQMREVGLIDERGRDTFNRRVVFSWGSQWYGRSIEKQVSFRHRFLSGSKGGLYQWSHIQEESAVILVEGVFDVAALWQAGFPCVTCAFGTHLNQTQWTQLAHGLRTVFIAFDGDEAGQCAAVDLAARLGERGQPCRRVVWPAGHDAASYFAAGALAADFRRLLENAPS